MPAFATYCVFLKSCHRSGELVEAFNPFDRLRACPGMLKAGGEPWRICRHLRKIHNVENHVHHPVRLFGQALLCTLLAARWHLHGIEFRGMIDLRAGNSDADRSSTRDGLDKTRFDQNAGPVKHYTSVTTLTCTYVSLSKSHKILACTCNSNEIYVSWLRINLRR